MTKNQVEWLLLQIRVNANFPITGHKCEEWFLSTSYVKSDSCTLNVKSDYSPYRMWRVTLLQMWRVTLFHFKYQEWLHIKCEEWLLSTSQLKSDSSPHQMWSVVLLATSNVKIDSSPHLMWRVTPHQMWKVIPLHIKCEKWSLSTSKVKSNSSLRQTWRMTHHHVKGEEWLLYIECEEWRNKKSRVTPLHIRCEVTLFSTANMKGDSSPRQDPSQWRVIPLHIKSPLHTNCGEWLFSKCEEWLLFTSYVKSDSSPCEMRRVTPLHIKC
jgi:hypothetical protein